LVREVAGRAPLADEPRPDHTPGGAANDPETAKLFGTMIDHGPGAVTALSLARQAVIQSEISGAFRAAFVTVALFTGVGAGLAFSMPLRRV
jgi:hypothetical protein